jgi:hypothetical protein
MSTFDFNIISIKQAQSILKTLLEYHLYFCWYNGLFISRDDCVDIIDGKTIKN